jgi:hypothetical protein
MLWVFLIQGDLEGVVGVGAGRGKHERRKGDDNDGSRRWVARGRQVTPVQFVSLLLTLANVLKDWFG